ncbi:MAG: SpoIIE family protein phosphatase [Bacteroidales bacterium]|nr:SpoIIE family protein phosphatase [Bacteroidales bacterium]
MIRKLFRRSTVVAALMSFTVLTYSQTYQFNNYGINDGLPNLFIYTINQDQNGFIWLGTGKGLCRFDGFNFHMEYVSDSLETTFPMCSFEDPEGKIYFGFNDGTVHYTSGPALRKIPGIDAVRINDIVQGPDSNIFIITQSKGIYSFDPGKPEESLKIINPVEEFLYCAGFINDERLILGTQNGVSLCAYSDNELEVITRSDELDYYMVQDIEPAAAINSYYLATEDNGIYLAAIENDSINISRISDDDLFNRSRIQSLMTDNAGTLWISTFGNGIIKTVTDRETSMVDSYEVLAVPSGLKGNDIRTSYQDSWGNIWIGLFGDGVSVLSSDAYKFYTPGQGKNENNIIYVGEYNNLAFAGTGSGFYTFDADEGEVINYTDLSSVVSSAMISDYYINDDGSMYIGTEGKGVYWRGSRGESEVFFRSGNNLENYITDILDEGDYIWLGTRSGVIIINKQTGSSKRYTTAEKLPHNSINQLIPGEQGNVLIATEGSRLYYLHPEKGVIAGKVSVTGGVRNVFQSFDIGKFSRIWGATKGAGVFCFEKDSAWSINSRSGLLSDFCYSLLCDSRSNIWVGHQRGVSVYDQSLDVIRTYVDVFSTGADCNDNAICETSDGHILIGTTEGFMVYDPEKDKSKKNPPRTNILSVRINGEEMPLKEVYNLPYSPDYNVSIGFVGLNYSDPEKVYYSYSMEGYDTKWSDPTYSRNATYRLGDGRYRFNVLAYTSSGLTNNNIKSFRINISKPYWQTWWFITGSAILLMALMMVIIKVRERAQARKNRYLEDELGKRTDEVVKQKEEIETQNREITDSINYAQRIQASLLPPVSRLSEQFRGSFVFYRPRDIVSGDFYWFDVVSDEKIIIVCADSTGHGVPGAFMSMIGSALLQEIVGRKEITRPSEVLKTLDKEITTTLNQTGDDTSNDGMDMVVCEYNPKTRLLRFASALRPVIIVMDGEQYYIRGNKHSVGGEFMGEKFFDDQEYYLREDDIVYIFSDGYPDQFGGPDGKKLKIVRLKRLIENIKDLDMAEQEKEIADYFDKWKGDEEQVDDVLLMAIKV